MFPTGINFNAIRRAGDIAAQKSALVLAIGAECAAQAVALDLLGPQAGRAFAPEKHLLGMQPLLIPSDERIKAYLQGERPGELLGQKWMVPSDSLGLNAAATLVQGIYRDGLPAADLGYTRLFRYIDMRNSPNDRFKLVTGSMAYTWDQVAEGGEIKLHRLDTETEASVKYIEYGDGFSVLDNWVRFNQWYIAEERIGEFFASWYHKKAARHYGLITALGAGINQAFGVDNASTFNAAASALITGLDTAGFKMPENPQLKILVHPTKVGLVLAMLQATQGSVMVAYGTQKQPIAFNVDEVISSTHVDTATNGYYLIFPDHKLVRADWRDFSTELERDAAKRGNDVYGSGQYNAAVGLSAQVKRVLFA